MLFKTNATSVWNPWRELDGMSNALEQFLGLKDFTPSRDYPPVNIWQNENCVKLTAKLPGMKLEDLDVSLNQDTLTIKCARQASEIPEETEVVRSERLNGNWTRSFALPFSVEESEIKAAYKDGILSITLPKAKTEQPRKILING